MITTPVENFRGRKQKVGSIVDISRDGLHFFIAYCPECRGKCSVTYEEAKVLMRRFGGYRKRPMQRMAVKMLRKYTNSY